MVFNQLCNKCKTTRKFISAKKVSEPNKKSHEAAGGLLSGRGLRGSNSKSDPCGHMQALNP